MDEMSVRGFLLSETIIVYLVNYKNTIKRFISTLIININYSFSGLYVNCIYENGDERERKLIVESRKSHL